MLEEIRANAWQRPPPELSPTYSTVTGQNHSRKSAGLQKRDEGKPEKERRDGGNS